MVSIRRNDGAHKGRRFVLVADGSGEIVKRAFTRIELLVVLAVAALLVGVRLPALGRVQTMSKIAQCAANLKADAMVLQMYGADSAGRLPIWSGGNWPWDISVPAVLVLSNYGAQRAQMYDPGFPAQNIDRMWPYNGSIYYVATGYTWCFSGGTSTLVHDDQNSSLMPGVVALDRSDSQLTPYSNSQGLLKIDPTKRVLIADTIISNNGQNDPAQVASYQWTMHTESGTPFLNQPTPYGLWKGSSTSHLASAPTKGNASALPLGGNEAMLDGRVKWCSFDGMRAHTSGGDTFWFQADPGKL